MLAFSVTRLIKCGWKVYRIRCQKRTFFWKIEEAKLNKQKEQIWTTDLDKLTSEATAQQHLDKLLELFPKAIQL